MFFQMLGQLNVTLEEENKALMEQVTKLVSQVCGLVTKCFALLHCMPSWIQQQNIVTIYFRFCVDRF